MLEHLPIRNTGVYPSKANVPSFIAHRGRWFNALRTVYSSGAINRQTVAPRSVWELVVSTYVSDCIEHQVDPYSSDDPSNVFLYDHLIRQRQLVVKFITNRNLQNIFQIKRTVRRVTVRRGTFTISIDGRCQYYVPDMHRIVEGMFRYSRRNKAYTAILSKYAKVMVYNEGAGMGQRWHLAYEIYSPKVPNIRGIPMPTLETLEQYINDVTWPEVTNRIRISGLSNI